MFIVRITFVLALLLQNATACFAQSDGSQQINIASGSSIRLQANTTNASSYQWLKDNIFIAGAVAKSYTVTNAGKYVVVAFNAEGCASPPSMAITIIVDPPVNNVSADLSIVKSSEFKTVTLNEPFDYTLKVKNNGPHTATSIKVLDPLPDNLILVELAPPTIGIATYDPSLRTVIWSIPAMKVGELADLKIKAKTPKYGMIKNTATLSAAETDPALVNNSSTDEKVILGITIPNVFTPNEDGKNDVFEILGLQFYQQNEISILNRWGSTVYEKKGYQNDWTANGLSEGTYFYVIKVKANNSMWQEFKGYVTVMR